MVIFIITFTTTTYLIKLDIFRSIASEYDTFAFAENVI